MTFCLEFSIVVSELKEVVSVNIESVKPTILGTAHQVTYCIIQQYLSMIIRLSYCMLLD